MVRFYGIVRKNYFINIYAIIQEHLLCNEANKHLKDVKNTFVTVNAANTAFTLNIISRYN